MNSNQEKSFDKTLKMDRTNISTSETQTISKEKLSFAQAEPRIWQKGEVIEGLYEVRDMASGGMGDVYFVNHNKWNIMLAVKSPNLKMLGDENNIKRFIREAETWVDIGKHPNVTTCFYVRIIEGIPRIFIEYVEGGNLKEWMEKGKLENLEDILDIAIQISEGMAHAHNQKNLIHRDLKPANVLLTKDGSAKITDFGLVKRSGQVEMPEREKSVLVPDSIWETMTMTGTRVGTPAYMPPEQWDAAHEAGRGADIYSFGIMLYEMLCGKRPFELTEQESKMHSMAQAAIFERKHKEGNVPAITREVPASLSSVVNKCIEKSPDNRYNSFKDLSDQFKSIYLEVIGKEYPRECISEVELKADDLNNRALSLLDLNQENKAIECWKEAIKISPQHLETNFNLGYWQWKSGKVRDDQYLQRLHDIEKKYNSNCLYWYSLGLIHLERADLEESKKVIKQAISLGFEDAESYNALGMVHLGIGEINDAIYAFNEAVKRSRDQWQPRFNLIFALLYAADMDASKNEFLTILENSGWKKELEISGISCFDEALDYFKKINLPSIKLEKVLDESKTYQKNSIIKSTIFSPDGKYALSSGDKTLQMWDIKTGECIRTFEGSTLEINSAVFSSDGRFVLSGNSDKTLRLWDVKKGVCIRTFKGHDDVVYSVAISPDGRFALSGSDDETLRLWDIETSECIRTFRDHNNTVNSVAFSPDGKYALSGSLDKTIRIWNVENGECAKIFKGHTVNVSSVAFSPNGRFILSGSWDRTLRLWNVETCECIRTFRGHTNSINSVNFSPDGKSAISGGREASPRVWSIETGECIILPKGPFQVDIYNIKYDIQSVCFSPDGKYALFGADYGFCALWDVKTGKRVRTFTERDNSHKTLSVAFSPDGKYALAGDSDSILRLWDVKTGECIKTFGDGGVLISRTSVAFSPDGRHALCIHGFDNYPRLWDVQTGEYIRTFEEPRYSVLSVAFSPDGRYILTGSYDKTLRLWDFQTGKCIRSFKGYTEPIWSVAFSPDGLYAFGSGDKTLRLWDIKTGECVRTFKGHTDNVSSVAFSFDSRYILSGDFKCLRLWDIKTGECIRTFEGDNDGVYSVAFSPNGLYALSSDLHILRLWDINTGRCIRTFESGSLSVAFSPDGFYALSGGTLSLWNVKYSNDISIYPLFNFILCSTRDVLEDLREETEAKELIIQARSLIESNLFSQSYRLLRKAQQYRGFDNFPEVIELITLCSSVGKRVGLCGAWCRIKIVGPSSRIIRGPYAIPAISPDGNYAIFKGDRSKKDNTFTLLDLKTGEHIRTFKGHTSSSWSFAFSPDGKYILSTGDTNSVEAVRSGSTDFLRLWDIKTGECVKNIERANSNDSLSVVYSPDGKYVISGGSFKSILLWDITTGVCIRTFEGHSLRINSITFSTDGKFILSGSSDRTIRLWDVNTGECTKIFIGNNSDITFVGFTPDGKGILSLGEDLRLWDVETGKCIQILKISNSEVTSAAFTSDSRYIFIGRNVVLTSDGRYILSINGFQLLDVETGKFIKTINKINSSDNIIHIWELDWELEFPDDKNAKLPEEVKKGG